jgi:hypothetical protein
MANDSDWQRRSDDWVQSMHESRLRKEQRLQEKHTNKEMKEEKTKAVKTRK